MPLSSWLKSGGRQGLSPTSGCKGSDGGHFFPAECAPAGRWCLFASAEASCSPPNLGWQSPRFGLGRPLETTSLFTGFVFDGPIFFTSQHTYWAQTSGAQCRVHCSFLTNSMRNSIKIKVHFGKFCLSKHTSARVKKKDREKR